MVILLTGAASGIGRATALKMATRQDARLVLGDRAADPLEEVANEVRALGAQVETVVGDLADPALPEQIVDRAKTTFGGLDVLISNAGMIQMVDMLDMTVAEFDLAFAVNTRATWLLAKAAYPLLKDSRGCIVVTCSVAAYEPTPALGAYAPSKAALLMFVRQMANAWGGVGIRCNSVSPGSTATSIGREPGSGANLPRRPGRNPLGVMAEPEDQAAAIAFLTSSEARFINGADLVVDGGARTQLMTASGMADPKSRDLE